MDYGRLFMFMTVAAAVMAIGTHLWCWVYMVASRASLYRRMERFQRQLQIDNIEEDEIERRRSAAPRYQTYEQFQSDVRNMGVPLDDILDRLNGEFPRKSADIQKADPAVPMSPQPIQSALYVPVLATTLCMLICCGIPFNPKTIEELIKLSLQKHGVPPPDKGGGA